MNDFIKSKGFPVLLALLFHTVTEAQFSPQGNHAMDSMFPVGFPLKNKDFIRVSSVFGYRLHPIDHQWKFHGGIDLVAEKGKPIYATANGIASKVDYENGYGNYIIISHWKDIKTLYGHLWICLVQQGDIIQQGQLIGFVGDTGRATGSHLHYELWYNKKKLSPLALWKHCINIKINTENIYRG
ncbi:M23 family metallopeptidase [Allomuricauda taeanensis]|uniref:M23 family metallopeptidase n=1 Tax=Flagellimonas taeanensis TaxID=1005926 RepID=UPI002E7B8151|nr:M23 family metallopeptidase [Allomuricauda taeanensis]MEE1964575.1 M23 family metallopeptidase [Allomuricauda taeanensis]